MGALLIHPSAIGNWYAGNQFIIQPYDTTGIKAFHNIGLPLPAIEPTDQSILGHFGYPLAISASQVWEMFIKTKVIKFGDPQEGNFNADSADQLVGFDLIQSSLAGLKTLFFDKTQGAAIAGTQIGLVDFLTAGTASLLTDGMGVFYPAFVYSSIGTPDCTTDDGGAPGTNVGSVKFNDWNITIPMYGNAGSYGQVTVDLLTPW